MKNLRVYRYFLFGIDLIVVFGLLWIMHIFSPEISAVIISVIIVGLQIILMLGQERIILIIVRETFQNVSDENKLKQKSDMKDSYRYQLQEIIDEYVSEEIQKANIEMLHKKSEYFALQSQINPHFLYNTLETIRGQALVDSNMEIAKMVETLASFFRYSISRKGNVVTLRDELNNIKDYMSIMQYRFYDRFSLEIDIDEDNPKVYDYYVPRLILQPIVENAILHGLDEKTQGGLVTIEVMVSDELIIMISDNGKGMSLKKLDELNERIHSKDKYIGDEHPVVRKDTGIALPNVNKRIKLLYGERYGLNVYSSEECGTDVEIMIPIVDKMENVSIE